MQRRPTVPKVPASINQRASLAVDRDSHSFLVGVDARVQEEARGGDVVVHGRFVQIVGCWTKIGRCAQENARACHLMVLLCMDSEGLGGVGDEEEEQGEEKHFEEAAW